MIFTACTKQQLAAAGFYYIGDPDEDEDSVACFHCKKELDGWDDGDDPLVEHLSHAKTKAGCSWAILMHEQRKPINNPTGALLLKAREATYKAWPHEKKRGWIPKSKKVSISKHQSACR